MPASAVASRSWADIARGMPASTVQNSLSQTEEDAAEVLAWTRLGQRVASVFSAAGDETKESLEAVEKLVGAQAEQAEGCLRVECLEEPEDPWPVAGHGRGAWAQLCGVAQHEASALAKASGDPCGSEPEDPSAPLSPAPYGEKRCRCHGEVLVMFGHYGWLRTSQKIDHPATAKNGGRIYIHRRDVVDQIALVEGDRVHFYLYVDQHGLGAEEICLEQWVEEQCHPPSAMNPAAAEFVPASHVAAPFSQVSCAQNLDRFMVNLDCWSDWSDSDESSDDSSDDGEAGHALAGAGYEGENECEALARGRGRRVQRRRKLGVRSCGSSSTGTPSDSELCPLESLPPGLGCESYEKDSEFGPPPGLGFERCVLSSPPGLFATLARPPPGLSLPPGLCCE